MGEVKRKRQARPARVAYMGYGSYEPELVVEKGV